MGDNVKAIEGCVFYGCCALRFVRFSNTLECIGECAFGGCESLEASFLPSTLTTIGYVAFCDCQSLRLLILPPGIDPDNIGNNIIGNMGILQIAVNAGVAYEWDDTLIFGVTDDSNRRVNGMATHSYDESAIH